MTVCIAAIADGKTHDPKLVLCADQRVEIADFASADIGFKLALLGRHWVAMMAGNFVKAKELVTIYKEAPIETALSGPEVLKHLQTANEAAKLARIEHHIQMKWGMSFSQFTTNGSQSIPSDLYNATWREIEALRLECEIIVAGYCERKALLFSYDDSNDLQPCDHFTANGSGAWIAKAALFQRGCNEDLPLDEVLYYVYEAKRLSEIAPGVGKKLHIGVMTWAPKGIGKRIKPIHNIVPQLKKCYEKFALKPFKSGAFSVEVAPIPREDGADPRLTTDDQSDQQPSLESPGELNES